MCSRCTRAVARCTQISGLQVQTYRESLLTLMDWDEDDLYFTDTVADVGSTNWPLE